MDLYSSRAGPFLIKPTTPHPIATVTAKHPIEATAHQNEYPHLEFL